MFGFQKRLITCRVEDAYFQCSYLVERRDSIVIEAREQFAIDAGQFVSGRPGNMVRLSDDLRCFATKHAPAARVIAFASGGSAFFETFVADQTKQEILTEYPQLAELIWYDMYSGEGKDSRYIFAISHPILIQFQIAAFKAGLLCSCVTTSRAAQLKKTNIQEVIFSKEKMAATLLTLDDEKIEKGLFALGVCK